ncbi:unnamed protein product [Lactuca virosa]|uniref:Uncharacterized protein n=1 Tax=Lactuca virosa TaxID=75947 RepID=A0AAU9PQZ0_9ASTR|nr:unnamed protein product [Lactuca virosa]
MGKKTGVVILMLISFFVLVSAYGQPAPNYRNANPPVSHNPPKMVAPPHPTSHMGTRNRPACNAGINGHCGGSGDKLYNVGNRPCTRYCRGSRV